jgi:hypothetical protein
MKINKIILMKADTVNKNGRLYTIEALRNVANNDKHLYYDENSKELWTDRIPMIPIEIKHNRMEF